MRELLRAVVTKKRILTLLELDAKHGGLTQDTIRVQLNAASAPCSKGDSEYASMYHMRGLTSEVERWGYFMPSAEKLLAAMFASEPIEWNRIGFFQVMSHAPVLSASPRLCSRSPRVHFAYVSGHHHASHCQQHPVPGTR